MNDFHSKWKTFLKEGLDGTGTDWNAHEKMKEQIVDMLQRGHASVDDILAGLQDYHGWTEQDMGAAQGALEDLVGDGILSVDGIGMYNLAGSPVAEGDDKEDEEDQSKWSDEKKKKQKKSGDDFASKVFKESEDEDEEDQSKWSDEKKKKQKKSGDDFASKVFKESEDDNKDDDGFVYATSPEAYKPKTKYEDDEEEKKTNESEEMNMKTDVSKLVDFLFHKSEQVSTQMEKIKGDKTESAQLIAHMLNELGMSPQEFNQILPKVKANMSELRVANIVREELSRLLK